MDYLVYLKNPIIAGIISGLAIVIFAYIDKRMNDRNFDNYYYVKLFVCVFILVTGLVYFSKSNFTMSSGKHSGGGGGDKVFIKKMGAAEVFTDAPDF